MHNKITATNDKKNFSQIRV